MRKLIRLVINIRDNLLERLFLLLPVKNKQIMFISSPDYSDNAKIYSDFILKNFKDYEIIWIIENNSLFLKMKNSKQFKVIKYRNSFFRWITLKTTYYSARSKYIFYTHGFFKKFKRKNQIIINLWHGSGFKKQNQNSNFFFDYVLVPGDLFIDTKAIFFNVPKSKILPLGYPRYDYLLNNKISHLSLLFEGNINKKVIFWLPTYRDYMIDSSFIFDHLPIVKNISLLEKLNDKLNSLDIFLVIKLHKNVNIDHNLNYSNISFMDNSFLQQHKIDLYELLVTSDGLITDYSSVSFDYLLVDKPIAYTLDDYNLYHEKRGFVFDDPLLYMPGNKVYNFEGLVNFFELISKDIDEFQQERQNVKFVAINESENYCHELSNAIGIHK